MGGSSGCGGGCHDRHPDREARTAPTLIGQIDLDEQLRNAQPSRPSPKPKRGFGAGEPNSSTGPADQTSHSHAAARPHFLSGKPAPSSSTQQGRWPDVINGLPELIAQLRTWLDLPDPGPTIASCAAAATVPSTARKPHGCSTSLPRLPGRPRPSTCWTTSPTGGSTKSPAPGCSAGHAGRTRSPSASSTVYPAMLWSRSATYPACSPPATEGARSRVRTASRLRRACHPRHHPRWWSQERRRITRMGRAAHRRRCGYRCDRPLQRSRRRTRPALAVRTRN